ncbi:MAG: c-type cytochrome [Burkholderiales bacterium]|nr:c-type cytochrome [Burkholderiales bacterium]
MNDLYLHLKLNRHRLAGVVALLLWLGAGQSVRAQTGDRGRGADLFSTHCAECHSMKEGKNKKGPSLFGVSGAKAAQREGFAYSDAMKSSQIVWNAETLSRYLGNPKAVVPGGKMKYEGLESAAERADLIAYLASQGK